MFDFRTDTNNVLLLMLVSVYLLLSPLLFVLDFAIIQVYITSFIVILGIVIPELRKIFLLNYRTLRSLDKLLLLLIFVSIILSTLFSKNSLYSLYFGSAYEAMGALYWIPIFLCAILFKNNFILLVKSKIFSYLALVSIVISTLIMLLNGINTRHEGVLLQATSMGIWALFSLVLFIHQYINGKDKYWLLFIFLSLINLIATQSRIAYVLFFILIVYAIIKYQVITKKLKLLILLIMFSCVLLLASIIPRFNLNNIVNDQMYRMDLISYSVSQSWGKFLGVGPSSAVLILNDANKMPASLWETNKSGYLFDSSHNIYFDFLLLFGPIAALAFTALTVRAIFYAFSRKESLLLILLTILLANGLFNVTNILLTTLLIFFIVSLLPQNKNNSNV